MEIKLELDITCNQPTKDEKGLGKRKADELYFLYGYNDGNNTESARVPKKKTRPRDIIEFHKEDTKTVTIWQGFVNNGEEIGFTIAIQEQDNATLGKLFGLFRKLHQNVENIQNDAIKRVIEVLAKIFPSEEKLKDYNHDHIGLAGINISNIDAELTVEIVVANTEKEIDIKEGDLEDDSSLHKITKGIDTQILRVANGDTYKFTGGNSDYDVTFRVDAV